MTAGTYPAHVDATLDPGLSRWLWLVKWLLAVPHAIVLVFLWIAYFAVSVAAFFAILVTGRYPRSLFDFNVGVLRWTWRVSYYTYGALGTDRYPPFTLSDVPEYPAHFDVDYPEHLSRGLVLVKWWLLAIPHYLVVTIFAGGGTWALWQSTRGSGGAPGLIGLLVLVAAVVLAVTGRYPQQIFDFVLGMNRWALRVAAYAGLMTDEYPPFRLDMGGHESAADLAIPAAAVTAAGGAPARTGAPGTATRHTGMRSGWTGGRIVSVVAGSVLGLVALALLAAGGLATWATNTQRDAAGFLTSDTRTFATPSYAITSEGIDLGSGSDAVTPAGVLDTVRIRATSTDPSKRLFIGVAPQSAVADYLSRASHVEITDWMSNDTRSVAGGGAGVRIPPGVAGIWSARSAGLGTQTLTWKPAAGTWSVVVMNADASPGVSIQADAGASLPDLAWIAAGLIAAGAVLLIGAALLIAVPAGRASRRPTGGPVLDVPGAGGAG